MLAHLLGKVFCRRSYFHHKTFLSSLSLFWGRHLCKMYNELAVHAHTLVCVSTGTAIHCKCTHMYMYLWWCLSFPFYLLLFPLRQWSSLLFWFFTGSCSTFRCCLELQSLHLFMVSCNIICEFVWGYMYVYACLLTNSKNFCLIELFSPSPLHWILVSNSYCFFATP